MEIDIYEKRSGKCPILIEIQTLDAKKQKKLYHSIEKLKTEKLGILLKTKDIKQLETNLFELRPHGYRLTFMVHKKQYKILTIFKKQGNKTPRKELEKAKSLKKLIEEDDC